MCASLYHLDRRPNVEYRTLLPNIAFFFSEENFHAERPSIMKRLSSIPGRSAKTFIALATLGTFALLGPVTANAAVLTVDVSGIESVGDFADPENVTLQFNIGSGSYVTGIGFDVVLSAFGTSWAADFMVDVSESTYTTGAYVSPGYGTNGPGLDMPFTGFVDLTTFGLDFYVGSDGILLLTFRESWDDEGVTPDGLWVSGTLSIEYTPVPEPSSTILALSGLGLVLFGPGRRRS